jgi:hypothetical protein
MSLETKRRVCQGKQCWGEIKYELRQLIVTRKILVMALGREETRSFFRSGGSTNQI